MLMDIFSSLDAGAYFNFSVSGFVWVSSFMGLFIALMGVWMMASSANVIFFALVNVILGLVKSCSGKFFGGFALGQVSLFMMIFIVNIFGMIPNVFSPTSHLSLTLVLAMMIWFCLVLSGWVFSWKESAGHLVPIGSPMGLIPLLVLIESVSVLIRPITLGVRLAANITMGHLMLHVIGEYVVSFFYEVSFIGSLLGSVVMLGYIIFEFAVSFLQAYVFVLLVGLYSSDHPMGH
uniref:ATP synthase subunit a n=1 Tax=Sinanodonta woodiana TaxID=1069815 RepID=F2WZ94_SINWO|nr:ATP synthase F0 subunit 6 [Sinanodonta woodiana]ADP23792.1 ATP synthase F0 subunit 6 [Sinanodonta woodiana]ADP23806.1 ATP synthase F0 subunit 6 [Sinanodonta woodiana]ADP23820.1 ATP synthase F0 subunit 6 [Sinanodonta woodiana]ADP23834.1 ATP synthase F0 subunit 6 [Sinanodonta woodiana]